MLACADDARKHAFCLSTDATGVAIRPEPLPDGRRQPCKKGHFFVVLADKKHVFFEYQPKHTSAAVCDMFRRFSGYIQADAHAIYDALFRGDTVDEASEAPTEVACWSFLHATARLSVDLAACVAAPRIRSLDRPPRALPWRDVRRILRAIDVRRPLGCRDSALFLMMATYGMGAGEVREADAR